MVHSIGKVDSFHMQYAAQQAPALSSDTKVEGVRPYVYVFAVPVSQVWYPGINGAGLAGDQAVLPSQQTPVFAQSQPGVPSAWLSQPRLQAQPYPQVQFAQPCPADGLVNIQPEHCSMLGGQEVEPRSHGPGASRKEPGLAARLTAELKAGGEARMQAIAALLQPGAVQKLSFQAAGCRLIQLALELVDRQTAAELAGGLRGSVIQAVRSPHANHIVQKILGVLTLGEVPFIVEELREAGPDLARHEFGCRIYCRLLEGASGDASAARLFDELLSHVDELADHVYGHHVIECALEHGLDNQRSWICDSLRRKLLQHVWNRYGAYVLVKALACSAQEHVEALAGDLLALPSQDLAAIAANRYASAIVRAVLQIPGAIARAFIEQLQHPAALEQLATSKYGRRLRSELDAKFGNEMPASF